MDDFDDAALLGTWHVLASTFPMWLSGKRQAPRFHYGVLGPGRLSDRVTYSRNGREREIRGVDIRRPDQPATFRWHGTGLLRPISSEWQVEHFAGDWAVITFSRSLLTPAGTDVIARAPALADAEWDEVDRIVGRPVTRLATAPDVV